MSEELLDYLRSNYAGVFDEKSIAFHLQNHVGSGFADSVLPWVLDHVPPGRRLLDIGSGFGAFVLAARKHGVHAIGIELEPYEVEYARKGAQQALPEIPPDEVFQLGDGQKLPYLSHSFDAVTLWNVLEHVPDINHVIGGVHRVLKPGGFLFIICPNYTSFRREAHYQVPWFPWIPRRFASAYLKLLGKNPTFFEHSIHYRTNWEVLKTIKRQGFELKIPMPQLRGTPLVIPAAIARKMKQPDLISNPKLRALASVVNRLGLTWLLRSIYNIYSLLQWATLPWRRLMAVLAVYNPFRRSVTLCLQKPLIE